MPLQLSPTQSQIQTVLRLFLLNVLPTGVPVVAGQDNRVSEPANSDYVVVTPMARRRISTNNDTTNAAVSVPNGVASYMQSTEITFQLDVHGPNSGDNAETISTMLRDGYAVDFFTLQTDPSFPAGWVPLPGITPLHGDDPKQVPFISGESQYETRWIIEALIQADQTVTNVPIGSAIVLGPVHMHDIPDTF